MTGSRKKKLFDDDKTSIYVYILVAVALVVVIVLNMVCSDELGLGRYSRSRWHSSPTTTQSDSTD